MHVQRWIAEHRPCSILIEGSASYDSLIPVLVDPRLECPVAIFTSFVDKRGRLENDLVKRFGPARFAAFFPLCDYSPELVALRAGHQMGARLRVGLDTGDDGAPQFVL